MRATGPPSRDPTVRDLAWSDLESFVEFYYTRYEEVLTNPDLAIYTFPEKPSLSEEVSFFSELYQGVVRGELVCKVAVAEGRVIGAGDVRPKGKHVEDRHVGVLAIGIRPEWRGMGVGDTLMTALLDSCRGRFERLLLIVTDFNERARRLYRKHGFQECGRTPGTFKRGDRVADDILMWRAVEPVGD